MEKKKYKIIKSDVFKEQEKNLPPEFKKKLAGVLKEISENPEEMSNSMSLFGEPSSKELKQWCSDVNVEEIDLVLEYLNDKNCLNDTGKDLAKDFWISYVKESTEDTIKNGNRIRR